MVSIGTSLLLVPYPRCGGADDEGPQLEGVERVGADGVDATGEGLVGHARAAFKSFSH
jgi:hypothetical protein